MLCSSFPNYIARSPHIIDSFAFAICVSAYCLAQSWMRNSSSPQEDSEHTFARLESRMILVLFYICS